MRATDTAAAETRERLLDLSSGWPLLVSGVLCMAVVVQWVVRFEQRTPRIGDGVHVASYGFDLSTCVVPGECLVAGGFPKDGIPALTDPGWLTIEEAHALGQELRQAHQGKFIVDNERVVGLQIGGEARAYPVRLLTWHEIVNDTLGGVPIAVTYHPLCDSMVVFDRRIGGQVREFGVSGLLYNSNLVMYDRQAGDDGESLWSQLQFRAIAGPAAEEGIGLTVLPAVVVTWGDWRARYPETTIMAPDRERMKIYRRTYEPYFGSPELRYPVKPLPRKEWELALKEPVAAVQVGAEWHVMPIADVVAAADEEGVCVVELGGACVRFDAHTDPPVVWWQRCDGGRMVGVQAFWFAWYAHQEGEVNVVRPVGPA